MKMGRLIRLLPLAVAALSVSASLAGPANAATSASLAPSLSPNRLHAKAALTLTIRYSGEGGEVPAPLRQAVLRLPAGLNLEIPVLRSCNVVRLQARGVSACPRQSAIGSGYALVEGSLGVQDWTEHVTLQAFLGPPRNLLPTFEILTQGYKPIGAQFVLTATALPDRAPYGEELVMTVPPITTVASVPGASVLVFSLTIGASPRHRPRGAPTVHVPSHCPAGGLPFAADFTYADGTTSSAHATSPCPQ
jgi:hypothetical protein